ncbi:hypothetical protein BJ508DRAFT_136010 [Ascobolus immersus RN42]|uniref:Uncharacterized protein n=1 Tax=Ascobolus immersus RN42 TaxID=1160509 RepID=A0A3N4IKD6_ASCIM|nr:hypothetical protein BJ508DRAFT_136010 [Ascobolus immersus RN42]
MLMAGREGARVGTFLPSFLPLLFAVGPLSPLLSALIFVLDLLGTLHGSCAYCSFSLFACLSASALFLFSRSFKHFYASSIASGWGRTFAVCFLIPPSFNFSYFLFLSCSGSRGIKVGQLTIIFLFSFFVSFGFGLWLMRYARLCIDVSLESLFGLSFWFWFLVLSRGGTWGLVLMFGYYFGIGRGAVGMEGGWDGVASIMSGWGLL